MSDAIERYANNRTPPRPEEIRTGNTPPGRSTGKIAIKRDANARSGRRYRGNLLNADGTIGAAVQFVIENDPGVDNLVRPTDVVWAIKCPARLAGLADWGTVAAMGAKYLVDSPPFGMIT